MFDCLNSIKNKRRILFIPQIKSGKSTNGKVNKQQQQQKKFWLFFNETKTDKKNRV